MRDSYPYLDIEVDGGVGPETIEVAAEAGANMIVSGTAVVRADKPGEVIRRLRSAVDKEIRLGEQRRKQ